MIGKFISSLGFTFLLASAQAATLDDLYNFPQGRWDGRYPGGRLVMDKNGRLFGVTNQGGEYKIGTVFELRPPIAGETAWAKKTIFTFNGANGSKPTGGLVLDKDGNLYGVTGSNDLDPGRVFELIRPRLTAGETKWTEKTLFSFNVANGKTPFGDLVIDQAGHLYGTTYAGGADSSGTVFELTPPVLKAGIWRFRTLHSFYAANGSYPAGGVILDQAGNLYGATSIGGCQPTATDTPGGVVYELSPPATKGTAWKYQVLVRFKDIDGGKYPSGELTFDQAGNLYGTTSAGGPGYYGTIYQLQPPAAGQTAWTLNTLITGPSISYPSGGVVLDQAGNIYGQAQTYGLFKLSPSTSGKKTVWTPSPAVPSDASIANSSELIFDPAGNLYGTTSGGVDRGTVFQVTLP